MGRWAAPSAPIGGDARERVATLERQIWRDPTLYSVRTQRGLTLMSLSHTGTTAGFYNTSPVSQPTRGADLTNNIASGGTANTFANYTDLTTYANDAAAIRNNLYRIAQVLKEINDGLRDLGLLS